MTSAVPSWQPPSSGIQCMPLGGPSETKYITLRSIWKKYITLWSIWKEVYHSMVHLKLICITLWSIWNTVHHCVVHLKQMCITLWSIQNNAHHSVVQQKHHVHHSVIHLKHNMHHSVVHLKHSTSLCGPSETHYTSLCGPSETNVHHSMVQLSNKIWMETSPASLLEITLGNKSFLKPSSCHFPLQGLVWKYTFSTLPQQLNARSKLSYNK